VLEHHIAPAGLTDIHPEGGSEAFEVGNAPIRRIPPHSLEYLVALGMNTPSSWQPYRIIGDIVQPLAR
jgi:hypothetical protein